MSFPFREPLNGIPKHGPRHFFIVLLEELFFGEHITLAHFAQHPSYSLVNKIVIVLQKDLRDPERVIKIILFDKRERRQDRDPPLPEVL